MLSKDLLGITFANHIDKFKSVITGQYYSYGEYQDSGELHALFQKHSCKHYYITDSVIQCCAKIKISEPFDLEWLQPKVENGLSQWSFGDRFIRFYKNEQRMIALYGVAQQKPQLDDIRNYPELLEHKEIVEYYNQLKESEGMDYAVFDFDLVNKTQHTFEGSGRQELEKIGKELFFRLLIFVYLTEVEVQLLLPGARYGAKASPTGFKNKEPFPFVVINANWNKISVRTEGFMVTGESGFGFARLQRCGTNRNERKLVWIMPHQKHGYVRGAKKPTEAVD